MLGYGLSWLLALVSLGLVMGGFLRVPLEHDVHCCFVFALVSVSFCSGGVEPQLYADNLKCVSGDLACC